MLGSISTGVLIARRIKPDLDLTKVGSGNIGATNVTRALGWKWGVVTMIGDCLKGYIPVRLAIAWDAGPLTIALAGFAAFLGHLYPLYLNLKGGKGVATSLGIWLAISPLSAFALFFIWGGASLIARSTAVGALSGALALPIIAIGLVPKSFAFILLAFALSLLVFYSHRDNLRNFIRGQGLR